MTLVKRNYNNWDNLFDEVLGNFAGSNFQKELQTPPVNISEHKDAFELLVSAPGLQKQDFKLSIDDNLLTISYEKADTQAIKEQKVHRQEFSTNSFKRTFTLDEKIDAENISAKYENGLLQVTLPKKEAVKLQPKAIDVR